MAARRTWNKARLEMLSDGVFAIVMTLLVLELKVPELPRRAPASEVLHTLLEHWPLFFSFVVTFMMSAAYWLWHQMSFHELTHVDQAFCGLNLVFLMFMSLLPFSTAMLGSFTLQQPVSLTLYFGNQLALSMALNASWIYAKRHHLLTRPGDDPEIQLVSRMFAGNALACLIALSMVFIRPRSCFGAFGITQILSAAIARRRYEAATKAPRERSAT